MTSTLLFSSTDQLIDTVYPVIVVDLVEVGGQSPSSHSPSSETASPHCLETNAPNVYRIRFHDRLSTGRGDPEDAAVLLEKVTQHPGSSSESITVLYAWPIEYIRRYGCETKNIFILELGRRCAGFPNQVIRFDTRPAKASSLESDFAHLVKKVLKFMDPSAKMLSKNKSSIGGGVAAFFSKKQSPFVSNAASCEYAELAPYQAKSENQKPTASAAPPSPTEPAASTHYARVVVKQL